MANPSRSNPGRAAVETPPGRRKPGGSTRGAQEQHKRNTREHVPIPWLALGLYLACAWLWVPLLGISAFIILPSAFAPVWLWAALGGVRPPAADHRKRGHSWRDFLCAHKSPCASKAKKYPQYLAI